MRRAAMWLNLYGQEDNRHNLKKGVKTQKMSFYTFFELKYVGQPVWCKSYNQKKRILFNPKLSCPALRNPWFEPREFFQLLYGQIVSHLKAMSKRKKFQAPTPNCLEYLASITLMSLWMPYSSNLALLPTSWKCRVCNTKVQCIFSTSFNAWSSKLGPYLTYSLVHEMIYLLLELKNNKLATVRSRKKYYFYRASSMFKSTFHVLNNNDKSWLKTIHDRELRLLEASGA